MEVSGSSRSLEIPLKRPKVSDIPDTGAAAPEPAPPVFNRKLRKAAVGTGCDIRLRVSVAGHPKPVLTWYHNDDPVPPSEAQDPGGLWIRDCGTSDAGLYTCVATNDLGEASCSAVLAIMDLGEGKSTTTHTVLSSMTSVLMTPVSSDNGSGISKKVHLHRGNSGNFCLNLTLDHLMMLLKNSSR